MSDKTNTLWHVDLNSDALMMSCIVSRSGALVGEAFDVMSELFVDLGVVLFF